MLKINFRPTNVSVAGMKSHQITTCSFLTHVGSIVKRRSMKLVRTIVVTFFVIQEVAHHAQSMFLFLAIAVKKSKEFHVKLLQGQNLLVKTHVASY